VIARARGLVKDFGVQRVLDGVTTEIHADQITCILGGSGSGKSVLIKCIIGLLEPTAGETELLGRDVHALDVGERESLLRRVGMLFQFGALFGSLTVGENVALPLVQHTDLPRPIIDRMVEMRLAQVGLADTINKPPAELSGGMQRRAALARASILDPEVLFCDEPIAGLDPVAAAGIDDLLLRFSRDLGMSLVVITHELPTIERIADRVLMIGDGHIIADGTVDAVRALDDPRVRDYFERRPPGLSGADHGLLDALRAAP
jgi:phospholipid/cholesterol/gamma-HCH transport system ATP-binding protein